jgi:hypothetical protein
MSHVAFRRPTGCAPLPHVNKARTTKHSLGRTEYYHLLELSHSNTNLNLTLNMAEVCRRFTIIAKQGTIVELQCTSAARVLAILSWKKQDRIWLYEHEILVPTVSQSSGNDGITCKVMRSTLHTFFAHMKNFHISNSTGECQDRSRNLSNSTERTTSTWPGTRNVT